MPEKSKLVTVILSALPGVGHMYLGWLQRGLVFMAAFLMAIFLLDWTGLSLFGFLMPVIWFYNLFDALQCYDGLASNASAANPPAVPAPQGYRFEDWHWLFKNQRWAGLSLIVIGALILFNKLALPVLVQYLRYDVIRTAGVTLVALLFIAGGIRLAWGKTLSPPETPETTMPETEQSPPVAQTPAPVKQVTAEPQDTLTGELPQEEE